MRYHTNIFSFWFKINHVTEALFFQASYLPNWHHMEETNVCTLICAENQSKVLRNSFCMHSLCMKPGPEWTCEMASIFIKRALRLKMISDVSHLNDTGKLVNSVSQWYFSFLGHPSVLRFIPNVPEPFLPVIKNWK